MGPIGHRLNNFEQLKGNARFFFMIQQPCELFRKEINVLLHGIVDILE